MAYSLPAFDPSGLLVYVPNFGLWGGLAIGFFALLILAGLVQSMGVWIKVILFIAALLCLLKAFNVI